MSQYTLEFILGGKKKKKIEQSNLPDLMSFLCLKNILSHRDNSKVDLMLRKMM